MNEQFGTEGEGAFGVVSIDEMRKMSGLEFLLKLIAGELPQPPIGRVLSFKPVEVEKGRAVFIGDPTFAHYNPLGSVHGGYAATLLDSAMACAIQSMLTPGQGYTTVEIKINYVKAITDKTGRIRAEGKLINIGRRIGTAEGRLVGDDGVLYAHGTTTCLIFAI